MREIERRLRDPALVFDQGDRDQLAATLAVLRRSYARVIDDASTIVIVPHA